MKNIPNLLPPSKDMGLEQGYDDDLLCYRINYPKERNIFEQPVTVFHIGIGVFKRFYIEKLSAYVHACDGSEKDFINDYIDYFTLVISENFLRRDFGNEMKIPNNYVGLDEFNNLRRGRYFVENLVPSIGKDKFVKTTIQKISFLRSKLIQVDGMPVNSEVTEDSHAINFMSFEYVRYHKENSNLTSLFRVLKDKGLVSSETTLSDFRQVFSGAMIDSFIIWTGTIEELAYFIKQLHNISRKVKNIHPNHWKITVNCFKKTNLTLYKEKQLRSQHKPKSSEMIESLMDLL